jgi:hypothetical protein
MKSRALSMPPINGCAEMTKSSEPPPENRVRRHSGDMPAFLSHQSSPEIHGIQKCSAIKKRPQSLYLLSLAAHLLRLNLRNNWLC